MAKKPSSRKSELDAILERLQVLEERIARLEGEHDAAAAVAADFAVVASPHAPAAGEAARTPDPRTPDEARPADGARPAETGRHEDKDIPEEILIVLSAAVAAFLGERAHVKQVRLLHSDAWAQQGRVSVMASHRWAVHR
jgi:hypothetical protein